jgi:hypothetical protein
VQHQCALLLTAVESAFKDRGRLSVTSAVAPLCTTSTICSLSLDDTRVEVAHVRLPLLQHLLCTTLARTWPRAGRMVATTRPERPVMKMATPLTCHSLQQCSCTWQILACVPIGCQLLTTQLPPASANLWTPPRAATHADKSGCFSRVCICNRCGCAAWFLPG